VKSALPEAPDACVGFEIRGTLPTGRITVTLDAQIGDEPWTELLVRQVQVKPQLLPLWLGGGARQELMFFQMPAHMAYPAKTVRLERYPIPTRGPKFSVVTPSYNHARFLPETMRSVLEQKSVTVDYVVQDGV